MSYELINKITVKKDGVYISTHSSNDTAPFHSVRVERLSQGYAIGGQAELDYLIVKMLHQNALLRGKHKSVLRYANVHSNDRFHVAVRKDFNEKMSAAWKRLSDDGIRAYRQESILLPKMKAYLEFESECCEEKYRKIAANLPKVD